MTVAHCACEYVANLCPMHKAAPAMFVALEEALSELDTVYWNLRDGRETYISEDRIATVRAALALARGEVVTP